MHLSSNQKNSDKELRYYDLLCLLFLTVMLSTYVLAYKMINVGGLDESGGILIFPFAYMLTDITTEVYGYKYTKQMIKNVFICCLLFATIVPLIAILPGSTNWPHQESYGYILGNIFRFFIANTLGVLVGIIINSRLIAKWKIILKGRYFWLRSICASAIGELVTSIIADIIAFFGSASLFALLKLMLAIYLVKLLYAFLLALPSSLIVVYLKLKVEMGFVRDEMVNDSL